MPSLSESITMEISVLRYYCFSCAIICNILLANFALGQSDAIYDTCGARPGRVDFAHFCAFRTKFKKPKRLFLNFLADHCVGFPDGCIEDRARTFFFKIKWFHMRQIDFFILNQICTFVATWVGPSEGRFRFQVQVWIPTNKHKLRQYFF